jgi:DNA replication protein DnaC
MDYNEDEAFLKAVQRQKELREQNKTLSEATSIQNTQVQIKRSEDTQKLIEEAKSMIKIPICQFCNKEQEISDKEYIGFIRYAFPIPPHECKCDKAVADRLAKKKQFEEDERRHKLDDFRKEVVSLLPKRFCECTFENYIGREKEKLELDTMSKTSSGLFITGNTGTGKTHLAVSYLKKCLSYSYKAGIVKNFIFTEIPEVIAEYYADNKSFNKFKNCDILLIDDLGSELYKDWGEAKIYELINHRYKELKQTIITSNLNYSELSSKIGDRSVSRMVEMCIKLEVKGEDYRLKQAKH